MALTGPDGRFDADPDELDALAQALRPWDDIGIGMVGPARATFRLSETETDDRETTPATRARRGGWSSCCSRPRIRACSCPPSRRGTTTAACAAGWTDRRSCCCRAGPGQPDLSRSSRPACAPPARRELDLDADGAYRFLSRSARRCSTRPGSACCCRRGGTGAARLGLALSAAHTPVDGVVSRPATSAATSWSSSAGSWPSATSTLDRGRDRGARRDQGAAGPAARPVGGASTPSSCAAGWSSCAASQPAAKTAGRGARAGRQPPRRSSTPRSRSPRVRADGLARATCSAGPPASRCGRRTAGRIHARRCGPTSSAACRGWRSCPRSAWAPAWPTTWGSARRCSCWRWRPLQRHAGSGRRAHAAAVPDVAGRQLAAGGGEVRARPARARAPRPGAAARRRAARARLDADRPDRQHLRHGHPRHRRARRLRVAAGGARRGAGGQEQPVAGGQGGAPAAGRAPGRAHRDAGGEPARRAVVDHGLPQPRPARLLGAVPHPLRDPDRAARRRPSRPSGCARSPGPTSCAGSRPTRRSSTTCPRRSRSSSTASSPPSRPRCTRRSSTT